MAGLICGYAGERAVERQFMRFNFGAKRFLPSILTPKPSTLRRGQTTVEYILVTVALLVVFVGLYRSLQWYLKKEFRAGGIVVMRMYKQSPK